MSARSQTGSIQSTAGREKLANILKECPVKGWAIPRDNQVNLRRAVLFGIQSAEAGELHEMSRSLKKEIKVLERVRRTSRGKLMEVRVDRAKIAAAMRADRDAR